MEDFLKSTALGLGINPGLTIDEKVGDDCFFFIFCIFFLIARP
jgi:hypothetical protein